MKYITLFFALVFFPALSFAQMLPTSSQKPEGSILLIWESQSYVPPFYKGKTLHARGGTVRIVAFPDAFLGNPDQLIYRWKIDGIVYQQNSGIGKKTIDIQTSNLDASLLVVSEVLDGNGNVRAVGVTRVSPVAPFVLFYENAPLGGIKFSHSYEQSVLLDKKEHTFEAYPYFFSIVSRTDPEMLYEWSMNRWALGKETPNLTVQTPESGGSTNISFSAYHTKKIFQRSDVSLRVTFEGSDL